MKIRLFSIAMVFSLLTTCAEFVEKQPFFEVGVESSMIKVLFDQPVQYELTDTVELSAAGGEYEAFQLVIYGHKDTLRSVRCRLKRLEGGKTGMEPAVVSFNPVGYVPTTVACDKYESSVGWWPDPLHNIDEFDVIPDEVQPVWVTFYVPRGTPAGNYYGKIIVSSAKGASRELNVKLRVWSFDIPLTPSLKTLTWVRDMSDYYGYPKGSPEDIRIKKAMYDLLLSHRLGPGGNIELNDDEIGYCMERGMNAFLLEVIPNLKRKKEDSYSEEYQKNLVQKLKGCAEKFGPRGWLDGMAYVYNYDEAGKEHWPLAKQMYELVKGVDPRLKVIQCLNIPEGVRALAGYADTWDVYIAQYEETGVDERVAEGDEAWLAVCCYPVDHPNFFLEYPAIDGRLIGWICWQTNVSGFEYWCPNRWEDNKPLSRLKGDWKANTFLNYNGDGYLTYPGPDTTILASIRLANFRDGLEDYEYIKLLAELKGDTRPVSEVVSSTSEFTDDPNTLLRVRESIAIEIEKLLKGK